jgi:PAS domain-containing protein
VNSAEVTVMPQKEIEIILTRQLASYLAMPIFLVDPQGTLIFYNEPAEAILGQRFDETGEMPVGVWSTVFNPTDDDDVPLPLEALPLSVALDQRRPACLTFWICGLDEVRRRIELIALPIIGQSDRFLGAMAVFWEAGG